MLVVIRGAGDIATGIGLRLYRCGIRIIHCELAMPTAIRRTVCFAEAVRRRKMAVEGVTARFCRPEEAWLLLEKGVVPVLIDPEGACISQFHPQAVVDGILAKRNVGTVQDMAPAVIGVGPGFTAGKDCHAVVETMRGHTLGRVYYEGSALPDTNIPGRIGGFAGERVLRAPADGQFQGVCAIGDRVEEGEVVAYVDGVPITATIGGILRGLLADGVPVIKGMKSGDIDPRGQAAYCTEVSDKALAVGGGVLEALLHLTHVLA